MKRVIIAIIRLYQATISPDHGILRKKYGHCPLYPSCSQYAVEALNKYGVLCGTFKAVARIGRCTPLTKPAVDNA
jgi:putative membrane protein insertion efficiency factor